MQSLSLKLYLFFSFIALSAAFRGISPAAFPQQLLSGAVLASVLFGGNTASASQSVLDHSALIAATEVKQGLYREYTVEKVDKIDPGALKRTYKTAEETDNSKNKYWTILAVLLAGSFIIPMVQYYWYVAEED